jgi:hypothetical protein
MQDKKFKLKSGDGSSSVIFKKAEFGSAKQI